MFEKFLSNKKSWLNDIGPDSEIVFSSRIRLARNLNIYPFPNRANVEQRKQVEAAVKKAVETLPMKKTTCFVEIDSLSESDRQMLLERHLISQELMHSGEGKAVIISDDERLAIMVNEEDHLRMQVVTSGFDLKKCWNIVSKCDDKLSEILPFSFMPEIGYLTSCPTNAGTGMRASCMLHLPALVLTKRINKVLELLNKIAFTTRGFFGEGTQSLGDFFQISNQVSLGQNEQELIDNLCGVVNQVKEQETDARKVLRKKYKLSIEDNVWRAIGILQNSRLISTKEALSHLSMVALGVDLEIITGVKRNLLNNLLIMIQPAHLQKIEGKDLSELERDHLRSSLLRKWLQVSK